MMVGMEELEDVLENIICILQNVKSDPKKFPIQTLGRARDGSKTTYWGLVGLVLLLLMKVCVFWGINQLTFRTNKQKETDLDTEKKVKF